MLDLNSSELVLQGLLQDTGISSCSSIICFGSDVKGLPSVLTESVARDLSVQKAIDQQVYQHHKL